MANGFDPYFKWLGIRPQDQPPHHYRLLGIDPFTDDADVIENAADQRMSHVRSFQVGPHADESQKILNELAAAKVCLLGAQKKVVYDRELRVKLSPSKPVAKARPLPKAKPLASPAPAKSATPAKPDKTTGGIKIDTKKTPGSPQRSRPVWLGRAFLGGATVLCVLVVLVVVLLNSYGGSTDVADRGAPTDGEDDPITPVSPTPKAETDPEPKTEPDPEPEVTPKVEPEVTPEPPTPKEESPPPDDPQKPPDVEVKPDPPDEEKTVDENGSNRTPVPAEEDVVAAQGQLRELFEKEFAAAKTSEEKSVLAKLLLEEAAADNNDDTSRYVLLEQARRLAEEAADAATALAAVDELGGTFDVDHLSLVVVTLDAVADKARFPAQHKALADECVPWIDILLGAERYDDAGGVCKLASSSARRARERDVARQLSDRQKEIERLQRDFATVTAALETLAQAEGADAEANLAVGSYRCLARGDWEAGLPHLVNGSDPDLKLLAETELTQPTAADERFTLGDAWWKLGDKQKAPRKGRMLARAVHWYRLALPELTGLSRTRVEKHLAEFDELNLPSQLGRTPAGPIKVLARLRGTLTVPEATKIICLAFSPDGKSLAFNLWAKNRIEFWNPLTGEQTKSVEIPDCIPGIGINLAFSNNGKMLALRGSDYAAIWDASGNRMLRRLPGAANHAGGIAFSRDNRILVAGGRVAQVWDAAGGRELAVLKPGDRVNNVAISPDGKTVATACGSASNRASRLHLYDVASGKMTATLEGHQGMLITVAFSPDGRFLASGGYDRVAKIWRATGGEPKTIEGLESIVVQVAFSPDSRSLAIAHNMVAGKGTVRLVDPATGEEQLTIPIAVSALAFSPDGRTLAVGFRNIQLFELKPVPAKSVASGRKP